MTDYKPSTTEYVVLGLLTEGPTHGFAISKVLQPGTNLGRVITVRRPLVYRALDRLVDAGLAEPAHTEPGAAGPNR
ncbi:MAG: PadR family transcriptional regulator, partial [Acidimicrobiia bacterium]